MGYFSNGTEGEIYQARYCANCAHGRDAETSCPIWDAHLSYNYDECNNDASILDLLIPRSTEGRNERCLMFIPSESVVSDYVMKKLSAPTETA